jgi:hypothetical protein
VRIRLALATIAVSAAVAAAEDPAARLLDAARRGDGAAVSALVRGGADPNARDRTGRPALVLAAAAGRPDAVRALLRAGARPDDAGRDGWTALHQAAETGDVAAARALLDAGATSDVPSRARGTALDVAERGGRTDVAALLRARGARGSGKSIGDTVCARGWQGQGYCGDVVARDATRYRLRVTAVVGCADGCPPDETCSAGRPVGPGGLGAGDLLWVPGSCLTHTGVR